MAAQTGKRNAVVTAHLVVTDGSTSALRLAFANGEQLTLRRSALTSAVADTAMWHGLRQKLCDAAALSRNPKTGHSATVADKFEAVKTVYDRLLRGEWNATREGGGDATGGLLFRALCEFYTGKRTPEQVREYLSTLNAAQKTAMRANSRIAPIIARLEAEKTANIDADALLDEWDSDSV